MIKPMLAVLGTTNDLDNGGFLFEPKLDGVRAVCFKTEENLYFVNKKGMDVTHDFPELRIFHHLQADSCILDGEIIIYDEQGRPDYNLVQKRSRRKILSQIRKYPATYVVFDILMKDGVDLMGKTLEERKRILHDTISDGASEVQKIFFTTEGRKLWSYVRDKRLEGVVAKRLLSPYTLGRRSEHWVKIKNSKTVDCVIVGYTSERKPISSLALAIYDDGMLSYVGKVPATLSSDVMRDLQQDLLVNRTPHVPVVNEAPRGIHWVLPKLVCEVRYQELTREAKLRSSTILRVRDDKHPEECTFDQLIPNACDHDL